MPRKTSFMVTVIIVHPGHMANLWTANISRDDSCSDGREAIIYDVFAVYFVGRKLHLLFPLAQDIALETKVSVLTSFNV